MIIDGSYDFGLPTITNSTAATASPTIYDAGSSKVIFGGAPGSLMLWFRATITADASPTILVSLVGSDESDLDPTNNGGEAGEDGHVVIASSGLITMHPDTGTVLGSGDTVEMCIPIGKQIDPKRYYGLLVTLGGTNPDLAAGQDAMVVVNGQTNMKGARAAVPA